MITACDLQNIKDVFNSLQDDVVCNGITIDNAHDNLYVYLEKAYGEPVTSKFKIPYSKFLDSSNPVAAICFHMEEAHRELMQKTEENSDGVVIKSSDIRDIIMDFKKKHPAAICVISVEVGEFFELQLDPGDGRPTQTREVPFPYIYYAKDPLGVLRNHLESMYNGLLKEEEKDIMPTKENAMPVGNDFMMKMARCAAASWYNTHGGPSKIKPEDVYVVWFCKTLQNWKALCSTDIHDGMYYEVTYDGDKDAAYVDAYKKWDNQEFLGENLRKEIWKLGVTLSVIDGKE